MRTWHVIGSEDCFSFFPFAAARAKSIQGDENANQQRQPEEDGNNRVEENNRFEGKEETEKILEITAGKTTKVEYRVGKQLASGGCAEIYRGSVYGNEDTLVALKVIDNSVLAAEARQEIRIHSRLFHPHIIKLLDSFDDGLYTFLVLPLCEQGSVYDKLKKQHGNRLPFEDARRIAKETCQALVYLHENCIMSRDIKVENILLDKDVVKLCDFGLSCVFEPGKVLAPTFGATRIYNAPEQESRLGYDEKVDIWCLGFALLDMLTGCAFFYDMSSSKMQRRWSSIYRCFKVANFSALEPELALVGCNAEIVSAVSRLLSYLPTERPSAKDALLLLHALKRAE